jgi:DNA-binding transcriptional LysR family regulator
MHAVLAGMGIGQVDSINAAAALRSGELVPLLVSTVSERMGLHLYYPQRADMPGRVRRFIDFAVERLQGGTAFSVPRKELAGYAGAAR